jgi:hypothetical protein
MAFSVRSSTSSRHSSEVISETPSLDSKIEFDAENESVLGLFYRRNK